MGKIRTRVLGNEDVEEQQKKEQKQRAAEKKVQKGASADVSAKASASKKATAPEEEVKATEVDQEVKAEPKKEKKAKKDAEEKTVVKKSSHSKKHEAAKKKVGDSKKLYTLDQAIELLKKVKYANFDESVELHLNVDEQGLKGEVELPHSTGKTVRVTIVSDEVLANIDKGVIDFDVLVAHPSFMPKLAKYARTLGPKGLMPNPKAGTISPNPEEVAKKFAKGSLRWKTEPKFPLLHQMIGKASHDSKALVENAQALITSVGKPHIKAAFVKTTMSPSLKLDVEKI